MKTTNKKNILYLSYDGLLEPLGHSQILSYLELLSKHYSITILSYEKKIDWVNFQNVYLVKKILSNCHINWIHLKYTSKPYIISTIWDIIKGVFYAILISKKKKIDLVHSRGDIPALIALLLKKIIKFKFLFDMRGFWADERVDWGIWKKKNILYKLFIFLEKIFYDKADGIISLTNVGIKKIRNDFGIYKSNKIFSVIPTCTNLQLFYPNNNFCSDKIILAHVGAVGTRYEFDKVLSFFILINEIIPTQLLILNKGEHDLVKKKLDSFNIDKKKYQLLSCNYSEVSLHLQNVSAGIFFSKKGSYLDGYFPTKLGEFLACGKPVITNLINNDVQEIISENKVGIIIENFTKSKLKYYAEKFVKLIKSDNINYVCRATAEKNFSIEEGAIRYKDVYEKLLKL